MVESSQRVGPARSDPEPGSHIGRYIVLDRLGAGGMGTVFLAYDPELDRRVAVKLLRATKAGVKGRSRLLREAQAMASLSHPNVVSVFDVGALGRRVFITMELVEGGTLDEWLAAPRTWREVVQVFMAAGRGLEAAHAAGLVHRDFKPENVLLTKQGEVRVTDFGLVRRADPSYDDEEELLELEPADAQDSQASARRSDLFSTPLTRVGALLGTPAYMAPEQFLGLTPDARADQFSFCVALFCALAGVMPFGLEDVDQIRERVLRDEREPFPREAKVPAWVREVVERGLAHEREQRWASMSELLDALARDPRRKRVRWAIAAAALAAVCSVGLGLGLVERGAEQACLAEGARVEQSWSPAQRAALREAMEAVGLEDGARSWTLAEAAFDAWASEWSSARARACRVRDRAQAACLDRQLVRFEGTLDALEQPSRLSVAT